MKTWSVPAIEELDVLETKGGIIKVNFEGPFNIFFGDNGPHPHS